MQPFLLPLSILALFAIFSAKPLLNAQEKQEGDYSISLVQAAEAEKDVKEVDGRKILTEPYEVRPGDHLWRILREKGLLKKRGLQEVLHLLKRLNTALTNLDLLHPGETIIIPLVVSPITETKKSAPKVQEPPVPVESLKDVDLELYTVQPGDSVIKIVKRRYNIGDKELHDEYLDLLKKMNPSIESIHRVFPGQKLRMPIYSPQVVRMPLPKPPASEAKPETEIPSEPPSDLMRQVAGIFKAMGVDWLEAGQHFIPLKSGGQINLNADSFPIINLPHGRRVIVDFGGGLPERMVGLITTNWENYRVVRLNSSDGLKGSVGKILTACSYPRLYHGNEAVELPGDITLRLKADWIIQTAEEGPSRNGRYVALSLMEPGSARISSSLLNLLEEMGVRVVEYPPAGESLGTPPSRSETLKGGGSTSELVETMLRLAGLSFSRDAEIPVYQSRKSDFNLIVKADFLLNSIGGEKIIDLTGLGPEIVSLLKDHQFPVLRLDEQSDPPSVISKLLEFTGVPFDSDPHRFLAAKRDESRNISIAVNGLTFSAHDGQKILVPACALPETLKGFLSEEGYRILEIDHP